jgi:type IV secretion system protein TrbL
LLQNGPNFADSIIRSLRQLGDSAAGTSGLSPTKIVDIGFLVLKRAIENMSALSPVDSAAGLVMSLAILLLLAAIAVNMLLLLVSAWIMMYAGIFFLGFGGSRWTSDMAINYYKTVLGVAVQLFAMILLVGIGLDLLNTFYAKMSGGPKYEELATMLVVCFALLMLINRIPPLLAGIITGGGVGASSGIGNFGAGAIAGAALGAAGTAATAASMAGAAVSAGATSAAGGAQALMAAFSKASAMASEGGGMSDVLSAATSGGGNDAGGGSSLASAMGGGFAGSGSAPGEQKSGGLMAKAGKIAASTAANLAQGSWDVAKAKAGQMAETFKERADETVGGKVAAAIKASGDQESAFDGNSLGAGKGDSNTSASDEVTDFMSRANGSSADNEDGAAQGAPSAKPTAATTNTKSVFD